MHNLVESKKDKCLKVSREKPPIITDLWNFWNVESSKPKLFTVF